MAGEKTTKVSSYQLRAHSSKELQLKRNPIALEQTINCQLLPIIEKIITKKKDPQDLCIYENTPNKDKMKKKRDENESMKFELRVHK